MGDANGIIGHENSGIQTNIIINTAVGQSYSFAGVIEDVSVLGRGTNGTGGAVINVVIGGGGEEIFSRTKLYKSNTTITGRALTVSSPPKPRKGPHPSNGRNTDLYG